MSGAIYSETQAFAQPWIWVLVTALAAFAWWAGIRQIFLGRPVGSVPGPDGLIIGLWVVIGVLLPLFLATSVMVTTIDAEGLDVRVVHGLFPRIRIPHDEIVSAEAMTYQPLLQWGGWGFRRDTSGDAAYSVGGREAVRIQTTGGRFLLVGTRNPDALLLALQAAGHSRPEALR